MNDKLVNIQKALKAPKSERNTFANFDYRSAEKILSAVKPLAHKEGLSLILLDEVVNIGESNYVKSVAILSDGENNITSVAYAREEVSKKGMDSAQITGSTSSYARKYALCGLFAIDDGNDPDSQDNTKHVSQSQQRVTKLTYTASDKQRALIKDKLNEQGIADEDIPGYLIETYGVEVPLTMEGAKFVIDELIGGRS